MDKNINELNSLVNWYKSLLNFNYELMEKPISKGKFSVKEIIAHLYRWDEYLINVGIPSVLENGTIDFPNFNEYNHESARLVENKSFKEVIEHAVSTREKLCQLFIDNEQYAQKEIVMSGKTHHPKTNEPFTFYYLMEDFSEHDHHHKKQIEEFLHIHNS